MSELWLLLVLGVITITAIGAGFFFKNWQKVNFSTGETSTMVSLKKAEDFTEKALAIEEKRATQGMNIFEAIESGVNTRFKNDLAAIRTLKGFLPKDQPVLDVEPVQELPAFNGTVHFSQLVLDDDYDPRCVAMGRNIETGALCQVPLEDLQSLCINGLQKQGKSILLLSLLFNAMYRRYVQEEPVKVILLDIHGGYPDALTTRLEEMLPGIVSLCDTVFVDEEELESRVVRFLDVLITQGKAARETKEPGLTLLLFDEYTETVSNLDAGKEIEARVKRLFNYRKAGIFLSLAMFEHAKNANSAKGLNVSKMSVSKALFKTNKDEGSRFLPGGGSAASLAPGEYLLSLPGMADPERIKAPLFHAQDFQIFAKYIETASQETPGQANEGTMRIQV